MTRSRYPDQHIERAIQYAEALGWRVALSNGHAREDCSAPMPPEGAASCPSGRRREWPRITPGRFEARSTPARTAIFPGRATRDRTLHERIRHE